MKAFPYPHPDQLIELSHAVPSVNLADAGSAPFLHFTYREQGRSFQDVGLFRWDTRTVTGIAEPETAQCLNRDGSSTADSRCPAGLDISGGGTRSVEVGLGFIHLGLERRRIEARDQLAFSHFRIEVGVQGHYQPRYL